MQNLNLPSLDFLNGLLSAFDISGAIHNGGSSSLSNGLAFDMDRLRKDLFVISEDYENSSAKLQKESGDALKRGDQ